MSAKKSFKQVKYQVNYTNPQDREASLEIIMFKRHFTELFCHYLFNNNNMV